MKEPIAQRFCKCIKKVRHTRKDKKESSAIAICVKSVIQSKGKTLRKFRCKSKPMLETQNFLKPISK